MKKITFFYLLSFCVSCSQFHHNGNISITVSESEDKYKIAAHYPEENTTKVEKYLDEKLGKASNLSFTNSQIDAVLTFDDGTKFYMKNLPGDLEVKFNKEENSISSYNKIKALGDGLKPLLQQ